jgi:hypothetical protein
MSLKAAKLLLLIFVLVFVMLTQVACRTTWGAPKGDDAYDAESSTEAMEDEEEEDAWEDANR